jgi:hypothetical protein
MMSADNENETGNLEQGSRRVRVRFSLLSRRTACSLAIFCAVFHLLIVPLMFASFTWLLTPAMSVGEHVPFPWSDFATFFEWNKSYPSAEHQYVTNTLDALIGNNTGHETTYRIFKSGLYPRDDKLAALAVIGIFLALFMLNIRYRPSLLAPFSLIASFGYLAFYIVIGSILFWIQWNAMFLIK